MDGKSVEAILHFISTIIQAFPIPIQISAFDLVLEPYNQWVHPILKYELLRLSGYDIILKDIDSTDSSAREIRLRIKITLYTFKR